MDTKPLEKFAQAARRQLHEQVKIKLERVLRTDSAELRAKADTVAELQKQIAATSREVVIERVAYTWFNRFCALRYMDANQYTRSGVVSPAQGFTQPEILQTAKQGHIDPDLTANLNQQIVFDLLTGRRPSSDGQQEAYRLLLVAACNYYHTIMPFLFERIDDYTELLMPDDLLSPGSILTATREALTPEVCQDVEVIGWLYQFYISEQHDAILEGLKKNQKITTNNIPAATQLFTPHWIVRFVVENSLGRLWLLNRPHSRLAEQMPFYIKPEEDGTGFLRLASPEDLRLCDPAVGSAHMLTYAFDLLYAIYEEEGYSGPEIPRLILEKNLVGLEIDERAGALAAFALVMKARARDRRFFARNVRPHICVLQAITFQEGELRQESWLQKMSLDQQETLLHDLHLFREADNVGSLLQPRTLVEILTRVRTQLQGENIPDLFARERHQRVLQAVEQAEYLARKYHVVITNPPYMGKGMNDLIKDFLQKEYKDSKSDLFTAFIVRSLEFTEAYGQIGLVTPYVWMFLSSHEKLRDYLLSKATITNLVQLEYNAFAPATIPVCAFTLEHAELSSLRGGYVRLSDFKGAANQAPKTLEAIENPECGWFYRAAAADFKKIPSSPIAYWLQNTHLFEGTKVGDFFFSGGRNKTHNNEKYLRFFWEVARDNTKWKLYVNGGDFRKYYGNEILVVDWSDEARLFYDSQGGLANPMYWDKEGITWTLITSSTTGFRIKRAVCQYSSAAPTIFNSNFHCDYVALAYLNSPIPHYFLKALNPTMNNTVGDILSLPFIKSQQDDHLAELATNCLTVSQADWNSAEISQDFKIFLLIHDELQRDTLSKAYHTLETHWQALTLELQNSEQEINRIFLKLYGMQNVLSPEVPLEEITLNCNPYFRYSSKKSEAELENLLRADTMREFISYAVGCMFGRYSLDKPGLILANQGDTLEDYLRQVPHPTFLPDKDNAIPILDGDWFPDDISERFKRFLRLTFGDSQYEENLDFIEEALGRDIRSYFLREFYDHHIKMYKKRPIYWLFSSPNGSFNVLIYMHRYRPDTVSVILNDYLREFRAKLQGHKTHLQQVSISPSSSPRDKTRAIKDIEQLDRILNELSDYENNILYPLATRQVQIDLDDGVLVNYNKLGPALKKVTGLSGQG